MSEIEANKNDNFHFIILTILALVIDTFISFFISKMIYQHAYRTNNEIILYTICHVILIMVFILIYKNILLEKIKLFYRITVLFISVYIIGIVSYISNIFLHLEVAENLISSILMYFPAFLIIPIVSLNWIVLVVAIFIIEVKFKSHPS